MRCARPNRPGASPAGEYVFGIDWGCTAFSVVALVLVSGLLIGFVEELLTRGIAVKTLRHAGDAEWTVAALSSLVFAASHGIDIFGQALATVGFRWFTRSPSA